MWSNRERGSRFKVRSRGSSRLKIKQEARVRKLHCKRRMLLHMMKGKATSETDKVLNLTTAIMGADQRNTLPRQYRVKEMTKTSWKSVPVFYPPWSGEYELWTGLESIFRTSSLSACPIVHCTIIMDHNGLVEGPIDPSLIQSIVFDCFGPAEGSKERHKNI